MGIPQKLVLQNLMVILWSLQKKEVPEININGKEVDDDWHFLSKIMALVLMKKI
jgi:hypothetical protein